MLPWVDLHAEGNRLATPPAGHTAHPHAPKNTKGKRSIINVLVIFVCVCACSVCVVGEGAAAAARRWGVIVHYQHKPPNSRCFTSPQKIRRENTKTVLEKKSNDFINRFFLHKRP
jgi:hypothetical protein